jgi:hypothetical protein
MENTATGATAIFYHNHGSWASPDFFAAELASRLEPLGLTNADINSSSVSAAVRMTLQQAEHLIVLMHITRDTTKDLRFDIDYHNKKRTVRRDRY